MTQYESRLIKFSKASTKWSRRIRLIIRAIMKPSAVTRIRGMRWVQDDNAWMVIPVSLLSTSYLIF